MKVGFVQHNPVFGDVDENFFKIEKMLKDFSTDVLVIPELFATGYLFENKAQLLSFSEPAGGGKTYEFLKNLSKKMDALIVGGFPEKDGEDIFNSAIAVKPDGTFHIYRKLHLFNREKILFQPGNIELNPFEFRGVKFGMLICFDWIFPESYRTLAMRGAQVILQPTNLVLPYCQKASFARAIENRVFIVIANRIGEEKMENISLRFTGESIIYSPEGEILARASENEEEVAVVEINPEEALDKWITERNHIFDDRRPEFYER
ncbi:beta-ureidopropionase [bacterium]|nr:MAG: beta-ureidopropionase [bacterium]